MTLDVAVSIIIPLYNRGTYIKRAIDSVLKQSLQNFEIIIVDGHSVDNGPEKVRGYHDPRIIFIEQEGKGVSTARNQGVKLAKSDFIAFLDADDEWTPYHLEVLIQLHEKYPEAGICATAFRIIPWGGKNTIINPDIRTIPPAPWKGLIPNYIQAVAYGAYPFITSSMGIPKNIFLEMGGYLTDAMVNEDVDLWLRLGMKYPVAYSWEGITIWHHDASNRITGSDNPSIMTLTLNRMPDITRAITLIENNEVPSEYLSYLNEYVAKYELRRARWNLMAGYLKNAREIAIKTKTHSFWLRKYHVLILSYIPFPILRFVWNNIDKVKQYFSVHFFH